MGPSWIWVAQGQQEQAQDSSDLWEKILVAAIGPTVAAILGSLLVTLLVWRIQYKRTQSDRAVEQDREDAEKALDRLRTERALRHDLIAEATSMAVRLYLATQHYWRQIKRKKDDDSLDISGALNLLQNQYLESRAAGEVLEAKLGAFYSTDVAQLELHAVTDLLTVRYFQLVPERPRPPYRENAIGYNNKKHSGLSEAQLEDVPLLLDTYRKSLDSTLTAILSEPMKTIAVQDQPVREIGP